MCQLNKLRAWDEVNKVMHYDFQYIESGQEYNDWIVFTSDKQKLGDKVNPLENPYFRKQFHIMQSIGLKDVNDKLIYTGDIVRGTKNNNHQGESPVFIGGGGHIQPFSYLGCSDTSLFEVVGNEYER